MICCVFAAKEGGGSLRALDGMSRKRIIAVLALALGLVLLFAASAMAKTALSFSGSCGKKEFAFPESVKVSVDVINSGTTDVAVRVLYPDRTEMPNDDTSPLPAGTTRTWSGTWEVTQEQLEAGVFSFYIGYPAKEKSGEIVEKFMQLDFDITYSPTKLAMKSVSFDQEKRTVKQKTGITAVTSVGASKLRMYLNGKVVKTWAAGYTDEGNLRTWKVSYAFAGAGERTMTFKALTDQNVATPPQTSTITITPAPKVNSVAFSRKQATVKQNVTVTAVTSLNAVKLNMYAGSSLVKSWTTGYTDSETTRTWKIPFAFSGKGSRTLTFKVVDENGAVSAGKTASITVTAAPALSSVKFSKPSVTVKQETALTAVTSTTVTQLNMYAGSKLMKTWTEGYTDDGTKRTWNVNYVFAGVGVKTLTFKAIDANGVAAPTLKTSVAVVGVPTLSSVKFSSPSAAVKEKVTITAVTSTSVTKLSMYVGESHIRSWTSGYTDSGKTRTWTLTYSFSGAGKRTLSFKAFNAAGTASAFKQASIAITKP